MPILLLNRNGIVSKFTQNLHTGMLSFSIKAFINSNKNNKSPGFRDFV